MDIICIFALFCIKHYVADFVLQTKEMVIGKGIYGDWDGIHHSFIHAIFTGFIVGYAVGYSGIVLAMMGLDFFIHYHVDYVKMRFGERDVTKSEFWHQLGLDQLAHYLTYVGIVYALV